jgi:hypothetical protein
MQSLDGDLAAKNAELLVEKKVQEISRNKDQLQYKPVGYCLFCEIAFNNSFQRWCNAECRDDYVKEQSYRRT